MKTCFLCQHYYYDRREDLHLCKVEVEQGKQLPSADKCPYWKKRGEVEGLLKEDDIM